MATFVKPNKRGAEALRCNVSGFSCDTSHVFGIGGPNKVIEINMPDGKKGILEISEDEWKILMSSLDKINRRF